MELGKRSLTITIDGEDHTAEVTNCEIRSKAADAALVTFANAAAGGSREYSLGCTFVQDDAVDKMLDLLWSHLGEELVAVVKPRGTAVGGATYTGTIVISEPDGVLVGGDAAIAASERFLTTVEWVYLAKPVKTP